MFSVGSNMSFCTGSTGFGPVPLATVTEGCSQPAISSAAAAVSTDRILFSCASRLCVHQSRRDRQSPKSCSNDMRLGVRGGRYDRLVFYQRFDGSCTQPKLQRHPVRPGRQPARREQVPQPRTVLAALS